MSSITTFQALSASATDDNTVARLQWTSSHAESGVQGTPRNLLQLEAAALFLSSLFLYRQFDGSWWIFAACFLLPDLAMLAYLAGPQWGARAYNAAHTLTVPLALGVIAALNDQWSWLPALAIWTGHIGFDRMLGYGLKFGSSFGTTHLGRIGRHRANPDKGGSAVD